MALPAPVDLSHYYSREIKNTAPSLIKGFYKYFMIPDISNLAGGLPYSAYFPFDTLEAQVAKSDRFDTTRNNAQHESSRQQKVQSPGSQRILVPHDSKNENKQEKIDVSTALQYGTAQGYPPLQSWVREFTKTKLHPDMMYKGGPEVVLTSGNTDGLAKVLHVFCDVWDERRDWIRDRQGILCEEFVYMNAVQVMQPKGINVVPIVMDDEGMAVDGPGGLRDVLENWDRSKGRIPHLMYTVTVGQNPASGILSLQRRRAIYALCQRFDILIIEDEPYWFLQYPSATEMSIKYRGKSNRNTSTSTNINNSRSSSGSPFLDSLVQTYTSMDTDGRVMRLDTFSKTIAPGCRLGWITAQPAVIDRIVDYTNLATQQPNGFTSSMVAELILGQRLPSDKVQNQLSESKHSSEYTWQMDGWIRWLEGLRGNYERRMQIVAQILEEGKFKIQAHPEKGNSSDVAAKLDGFEFVSRTQLYDFVFPMGGMFLWLRMQFEVHPLFNHPEVPLDKLSLALWIFMTTNDYKVLVAPGTIFCPTDKIKREKGAFYFRLCYTAVAAEILEKTSHDFVRATNDFFDLDDPQDIQDIFDHDNEDARQHMLRLSLQMDSASVYNGFRY